MDKDDEINEFWEDYENDNRNYRLLISFHDSITEYESTPMNIPIPKYKKKLTVSTFIKPNGNELF